MFFDEEQTFYAEDLYFSGRKVTEAIEESDKGYGVMFYSLMYIFLQKSLEI